jgi:pimeloyl-ACP methyl ester carboxylesterase
VLATAAALAALVVVGFPLLMYFMQDRLLFFPQPLDERARAGIAARHPGVEEALLQADGRRLQAWHVKGAPGKPLILYFGGNAEEVSWMIAEARERTPGLGWLLVNYPGYGGSDGAPSEAAISADALRWYDHAGKELGAKEIIAFGRSLGSGAAVTLASQRALKAVVLVTPYDSLVEVAKRHYPFLPVSLMLRHPFDSVARAPKINVPLLCIAASRDEVIPPVHAQRLYEAWGGPKRWLLLEEAGHNTTDSHPLFWNSVGEFLAKSGL